MQHRSRVATTLRPAAADGAPRPETEGFDERSRVALVVDDEPFVRKFVSAVLRSRGWSVIEASDGESALSLAPSKLDLLVTDYEMAAITGVDLAAQLRLRNRKLAVIMVSGYPEVSERMAGLDGPRTAFVGKPFPVEELISTVGSVTG
jgi:CheY-like chemotaxis protein